MGTQEKDAMSLLLFIICELARFIFIVWFVGMLLYGVISIIVDNNS